MSPVVLVVALVVGAAPAEQQIEAGRFGKVGLLAPAEPAKDVVLLLTDAPAKTAHVAKALAERGALVLSCDVPRYLRAFPETQKCVYPAGDLEALAQYAEKKLGFQEYLHPVVVGIGPMGGLAYASLAQAPKGTFRGAVSVGFCAEVESPKAICSGSGLRRARAKSGKGDAFTAGGELDVPWVVVQGSEDKVCSVEAARGFVAGTGNGRVVEVAGLGHALAKAQTWIEPLAEAVAATRAPAPVAAPKTEADAGAAVEDVSDLPLVEAVAPSGPGEAFAVLLSGDGGWAGIDRELAAAVGAQGVPVVGMDSLKYFWQAKTPEQTAKDVSRVIRHYAAAWKRGTVVMLGYSRGADVLPATVNRLDADARARVKLLGQVAAEKLAEFEVHVTDFVSSSEEGIPVEPEVKKLGGTPLVCIFGDQETDESLCPVIKSVPGVSAVKLPGGHHFGGDYAAVARAIIGVLPRAEADAGR
ncbi:MAG TPA: AcvB/VirJ family lysyl-phosphatidylglycerol hydrolase [Myxococcaceae bacterium]|nr:AcvB/VirJ family lysyl-phosphatidylglycerol hydrolase [Myxococcaceae bacterium]